MTRYWIAAMLSLVLSACGPAGDPDRATAGQKLADAFSPAAEAAARPAQSEQAFADAMGADNAYEIAAAKLAQQDGRDQAVKLFAAQMIQDHAVASSELRNALKRTHGIVADTRMSPAQQQALEALQSAGAKFDGAYAKQEIAAHEQELAALRDYADNGMDPALSEFAAGAVNMAADHLRQARKLS